ncbi:MAG: alanine racemase C-terminal domain-containing protein, partial [Woeseiaceae bacterium]
VVSAGYGDGYSRFLPNGTPVLVNGRRVPLVGTVSMDMAAVDLGPGGDERVGDPVILWGGELPAEEVARHAGTIAYQLVCGVTHRESSAVVPRPAAQLSP